MKNIQMPNFKTLQGKLICLLLLPVFLTLFSGGVLSFFFARNVLLEQWNESSMLKLQRAAHYIEMRLFKPIDLTELLFRISISKNTQISFDRIIKQIEALEGVVQADFINVSATEDNLKLPGHLMGTNNPGMMQLRHSKLLKISDPVFDADKGNETVTFFLNILTSREQIMGRLEIVMSFNYLLKDILKLGWWQTEMACIVDRSGKYMAHTMMSMQKRQYLGGQNDPLELAIINEMNLKPFGTVKSTGRPPEMIAGFYQLDHAPWTIILFAKGDNVLKSIINYRNGFALGSLFFVLIILLLIRNHVGKIADEIKILSKSAQNVARGEYGPPIRVNSKDEIGQLITSYNAMVKGLIERDFIRDSFGRYVDPEFAKFLLKHPDAGKLGGKRREVAILMSDIRGFTALSETLSPEIIINVLNQYFSHMITIIQKYNGIIVDFFGDSILVFFEPFSDPFGDTIRHCVHCAYGMQEQMQVFNQEMRSKGLPELHMGIGINSGQVIVGNIGSKTRAKYGIVGSAVNITSRIQAKAGEKEIIVSDAAYQLIKNEVSIKTTFNETLKGVDSPITLHIMDNPSG
jgi:class 3 adenylate cyclase